MTRKAPSTISITVPSSAFDSPEKLLEAVPEQALLMASLEADHVESLRKEITIPGDERKENIFYVDTKTFSELRKHPPPTPDKFASGANEILEQINKMFLSAPGSLEPVGEDLKKVPVDFFNYFHTSTISSMMHRAELFLVLRDVQGDIRKQVRFNLSTSNNDKDIKSMLNEKYDRGFGVSLDNISIISDAQDPALSKFVTCDMTVRMANGKYLEKYPNNSYNKIDDEETSQDIFIEDLFKPDKHEVYTFDKRNQRVKKYSAEIMLKIGYTKPLDELIAPEQRDLVVKNLHNMTQVFFLKIVDYDIIAEQSGQIVLNLKYASSFDADMDSKSRKITGNPGIDEKYTKKTALLKKLRDKTVKYGNNDQSEDTEEMQRFINYSMQAIAVAHQKTREKRVADIIAEITSRGNKTLVLPYEMVNLREQSREKTEFEGNVEVEEEEPRLMLDYHFASPTTRNDFLTRNKEQNLNSDKLRVIEFVLFGEIIDYVFQEFFTIYDNNKGKSFAEFKAAIFSAFSFGIYDGHDKTKVDKVYNMRDAPVSLDLLWDILISSPITEIDTGGLPKSRYYKDMISKTYSSVYQSCDKAVKLLSGVSDVENTSHMLRRVGVPEINAHEIYLPETCFQELKKTKESNPGFLSKQEIKKIFRQSIRTTEKGAQVSSAPDSDKYYMTLFFTSHIPFSPVSESREPDYEFKSFGQYGIVKGFTYSPVVVDGLLESAIATRTNGEDIGSGAGGDSYYKSLLKVDISTFGLPTVIPGMTIEISEALMGLDEGLRISNSLTTSYYVTRVQTTMNKGDYSTVIEGYPRLPQAVQDEQGNKEINIFKNPANKEALSTMLKAYEQYIEYAAIPFTEKPSTVIANFIANKFFIENGIESFFPKYIEEKKRKLQMTDEAWTVAFADNRWTTSNEVTHGPGKWAKKESPGIYTDGSRIYRNMIFGDIPFTGSSDKNSYIICLEAAKDIFEDPGISEKLSKLKENLRINEDSYMYAAPNKILNTAPILSTPDYIRIAAEKLMYNKDGIITTVLSSSSDNVSSPDNTFSFNYSENALLFMEIIQSCCEIWRSKIKKMVENNQFSDKDKEKVIRILKGETSDVRHYGIGETSLAEIRLTTKRLRDHIRMSDFESSMKELETQLYKIMDFEG